MKDTVRKLVNFRFDRCEEIKIKLEQLAAKGLFLKECGPFTWTFQKAAPQKLTYTVTYFSEASVFNSGITDNQQTYLDYASSAGWNFVAGLNQMQIFSSEAEHPIPFETDETEKLKNIKKCMNRSFIPSMLGLIFIFVLNLLVQYHSFRQNAIHFLVDSSRLISVIMMLALVVYAVYSVLNYLFWCKHSEKSIANGGACIERNRTIDKGIDVIFIVFIFASLAVQFLLLAHRISWFWLLLCIVQVPILMLLFGASIQYCKKRKASAAINRIISITVLIIATFAYLAIILALILKLGFMTDDTSAYRTVAWPVTDTYSHDFKLYSDEIPLTCEDLYGQTEYQYYSYESDLNRSFFLSKRTYRQDALPAKNAPPQIAYEILETQFHSVYQLAKEQVLEQPEWQSNYVFEPMDNNIFGTLEAYQRYFEGTPTGKYILLFDHKIVTLNMEHPVDGRQASIIKENLQL